MADTPYEASDRVDAAIESINLAIRDIRNFIYGLRPEAVDGSQVVAGIAALAEELRPGGFVDVGVARDPTADPGLSNAARHAHAGRIAIALEADGEESVLTIEDDGVGFDPERPPGAGHHGLANMRARAPAIGGRLEIQSRPGGGTRIVLRLPPATGVQT